MPVEVNMLSGWVRAGIGMIAAGWLAVGTVVGAAQAASQPLADPHTSYTADFVVRTDRGDLSGTVAYQPGAERREFVVNGEPRVLLVDRTANTAHLLMPNARFYVSHPLRGPAAPGQGLYGFQVERTPVGTEVVGGVKTTKYKATAFGEGEDRFDGFMWFTVDDILMRARGTVTYGAEALRLETEIRNLRRGPVEEAQFRIPTGFMGVALDIRRFDQRQAEEMVRSLQRIMGRR